MEDGIVEQDVIQNLVDVDKRGLLLVATAGAWLAGIVVSSWLVLPALMLLIAAGATLVCMILCWREHSLRLHLCLTACLLLGGWRYVVAAAPDDPQTIAAFIGPSRVIVRGSVSEEPALRGNARALTIEATSISRDGRKSWQDVHGKLTVQVRGSEVEDRYGANYGDVVELGGTLQSPLPTGPPGIGASMLFPSISVRSAGGNPILAFVYHLRLLLANLIVQSLPQPEAALLVAVLLSLRTPALKPTIAAFNATGLAHLVAPSGFKVTLLAGLLGRSMPWNTISNGKVRLLLSNYRNWRLWLATLIIVTSIGVYTVLSGAGPAAIRAGIMGILLVVAPRIGRNYNIYTALALCAIVMSLIDPLILWDVGFQLSFLGTLGIVILTPFFQRRLHGLERLPAGHMIVEAGATTLAAQIATLPIFAVAFHQTIFYS